MMSHGNTDISRAEKAVELAIKATQRLLRPVSTDLMRS
jgi:hypothetical protein